MTQHTAYEDIPERETIYTIRSASDWIAVPDSRFVHHRPSRTMFEITLRPDLHGDDLVRVDDLRVRLVHGCEGPAPSNAELAHLRYEAILIMAVRIGLIEEIEDEDDPIPF